MDLPWLITDMLAIGWMIGKLGGVLKLGCCLGCRLG
jgi:hypothetical protein